MWIIDLVALCLALPFFVHGALSLLEVSDGAATEHPVARVVHALDTALGNMLPTLGNAALIWLAGRGVFGALTADWALGWRLAAAGGLALLVLAAYTPVMTAWNLVLMVFCRNRPLHLDKDRYFPGARLLEDPETFTRIRAEVAALMAAAAPIPDLTEVYSNITMSKQGETASGDAGWGAWRAFFVRAQGRDLSAARAWLPTLFEVLDQTPEVYNGIISVLDPGRYLDPHRGHSKGKVRYHLGLVVPSVEDAWMVVDGEKYHWHEGEGVIFDDMFRHSACNRADRPRAVLFLDILRPLPGPIGVLNRVVGWYGTNHPVVARINGKYEAAISDFPVPA